MQLPVVVWSSCHRLESMVLIGSQIRAQGTLKFSSISDRPYELLKYSDNLQIILRQIHMPSSLQCKWEGIRWGNRHSRRVKEILRWKYFLTIWLFYPAQLNEVQWGNWILHTKSCAPQAHIIFSNSPLGRWGGETGWHWDWGDLGGGLHCPNCGQIHHATCWRKSPFLIPRLSGGKWRQGWWAREFHPPSNHIKYLCKREDLTEINWRKSVIFPAKQIVNANALGEGGREGERERENLNRATGWGWAQNTLETKGCLKWFIDSYNINHLCTKIFLSQAVGWIIWSILSGIWLFILELLASTFWNNGPSPCKLISKWSIELSHSCNQFHFYHADAVTEQLLQWN